MEKVNSLRPFERIKKNSEFKNAFGKGEKVDSGSFRFYFSENQLGFSRIGLSLSKKTGNAVKRNRIKRIIREIFRKQKNQIKKGYDIIIICRESIPEISLSQIEAVFKKALSKGKILLEENF